MINLAKKKVRKTFNKLRTRQYIYLIHKTAIILKYITQYKIPLVILNSIHTSY